MAVDLGVGGRVMKRYFVLLGLAVGVTVIIGVAAIVMLHSEKSVVAAANAAVADEGPMPELGGAVAWLNSTPLSRESLRGKVVLVNFWTYSCINSLRELPYIKSWAAKYKDAGLVVIGVHAPEFGFERDLANVRNAGHLVQRLHRGIDLKSYRRPPTLCLYPA